MAIHSQYLKSLAAGTLTSIAALFLATQIATAQTRIISLSGDLDFGSIPLLTSAQRTLSISNAGDSVLTISNLLYPPEPVSVHLILEGNFSGPIAPGGSQDVIITFTPLGTAILGPHDLNFQGYLEVDSDANGGTNFIAMSGVGTWPPASRIPSLNSNLDFGSVPIGSFTSMFLTLSNNGTLPLTISNITLPPGFSSHFLPPTIAPGAAINLGVDFHPTNVAAYGGIATVTSDSTVPGALGVNQFTVSGSGAYPEGKYIGLFIPTNNPAFENCGYVSANCTAKGKLNGSLTLAGKRYPFSGQVSPEGTFSGTAARKNQSALNVSFQYDVDIGRKWVGAVGDGAWTAEARMEQAILYSNRFRRFYLPDDFPITIAGSTNAILGPVTPGSATLKIKNSNATHITGVLGDGSRFSQNTTLCTGVPLYAPLYHNRGAIVGWVSFDLEILPGSGTDVITLPPVTVSNFPIVLPPIVRPPLTNIPPIEVAPMETPASLPHRNLSVNYRVHLGGTVNWFKPAGIDPDYPGGFSFQSTVTGSAP